MLETFKSQEVLVLEPESTRTRSKYQSNARLF